MAYRANFLIEGVMSARLARRSTLIPLLVLFDERADRSRAGIAP